MADRNLVLQLLITARDQASAALERVGAGIQAMGGAVSQALGPLRDFGALLAGAAGLGGAKELLDRADAYTRLTNQLRIATKGEEEYQAALEAVVAIARRSNADLDSTASLYGKIAQSAETLGLSQTQVADVTELVAKAMQLSGAEASAASGAILQLGQALGSGALRGDEFNSIMEASPKLMEALATGLGVAAGELRAMAEAGQLTADRVVKALLAQKTAIDEVYGKLPQTVGQAMTGLANAGTLFVGKLNEQTGATQGLASGLKFLAENLDAVAALMGAAFAAALAKGTIAFGQQVAAMLAAKAAARELAIAAAAQQQEAVAAAQGHLAAAQAAANRALAEQRLKLQVVAAMEAELGYGVVTANLTAARQQASAAATAATAATQRYAAAQAALVAAQGAGTASVGLFARAMGFLTGPVGLIALAVSAFAGLYAAFSKQKTATDALTGSTDQYRESLKNLNSAQLRGNLQQLNDDLGEQEKVVAEAAAAVDKLRDGHLNLYDVMSDSRPVAVQLTEAEGALADARAKLAQQQEKLRITQEALAGAWEKEAETNAELLGQYTQQATAMDKLSVAIQDRVKHLKTVSDAQETETDSLLETAKAKEDANAVDRLTIQLAQQRAAAARTAAELTEGEANAAKIKVAALESIEKVQGRLTPQEQDALKTAREQVAALEAAATAGKAHAAQLEATAKSTETGALATQRLAERLETYRSTTEAVIAISQRQAEVAEATAQAAVKLATAKGEETKAIQLAAEATRLEVTNAKERLAQLDELIAQTRRHADLVYAQAAADGVVTTAEQKLIDVLQDKTAQWEQERGQIEAKLPLMEREARQAEIMAGPIGALTRLYAEQTTEHERASAANERYYDTQIAQKDAAIAVAKAKGDEAAAATALAEKQQLEIDKAEALSAAKKTEATDAQNAVEAKKLEAAASDGISEAEQKEIDKLQEVADAKKAASDQAAIHAQALKDEQDAVKSSSDVFDTAAQNAYKFSDAAADVAKRNAQVGQSAASAAESTETLNVAFLKFRDTALLPFGEDSIRAYNAGMQELQWAIDDANAAAKRLGTEGLAAATGNADELVAALESSQSSINDAAQAAADNLKTALEDARTAAQDLRDELAGVATDYTKKILELQGDNITSLQIERTEKLTELEEKYAKAGQTATQAYLDAKRAVESYYDLKIAKQREDDAADNVNKTTNQYRSLRGEIEAASAATQGLAQADLSGLQNQLTGLSSAASGLAGIL